MVGMLGLCGLVSGQSGALRAAESLGRLVGQKTLKVEGETVFVFHAVPEAWQDLSFDRLTPTPALRISAKRQHGLTVWIRIERLADPGERKGSQLKLRDPFAGRFPTWNRSGVKPIGKDYVIELKAGEALEGRAGPEDPRRSARERNRSQIRCKGKRDVHTQR